MRFFVYVLHSVQFDKIYIGYTTNVEARFRSHDLFSKKGWTKRFRPWTLAHTEAFATKREALMREKQLKSAKGREFIRKELISSSATFSSIMATGFNLVPPLGHKNH
jgi:putative endonuclease